MSTFTRMFLSGIRTWPQFKRVSPTSLDQSTLPSMLSLHPTPSPRTLRTLFLSTSLRHSTSFVTTSLSLPLKSLNCARTPSIETRESFPLLTLMTRRHLSPTNNLSIRRNLPILFEKLQAKSDG
ncbi:hypothetical protein BGZ72_003771, partial [Mortierella alpina]